MERTLRQSYFDRSRLPEPDYSRPASGTILLRIPRAQALRQVVGDGDAKSEVKAVISANEYPQRLGP